MLLTRCSTSVVRVWPIVVEVIQVQFLRVSRRLGASERMGAVGLERSSVVRRCPVPVGHCCVVFQLAQILGLHLEDCLDLQKWDTQY